MCFVNVDYSVTENTGKMKVH